MNKLDGSNHKKYLSTLTDQSASYFWEALNNHGVDVASNLIQAANNLYYGPFAGHMVNRITEAGSAAIGEFMYFMGDDFTLTFDELKAAVNDLRATKNHKALRGEIYNRITPLVLESLGKFAISNPTGLRAANENAAKMRIEILDNMIGFLSHHTIPEAAFSFAGKIQTSTNPLNLINEPMMIV